MLFSRKWHNSFGSIIHLQSNSSEFELAISCSVHLSVLATYLKCTGHFCIPKCTWWALVACIFYNPEIIHLQSNSSEFELAISCSVHLSVLATYLKCTGHFCIPKCTWWALVACIFYNPEL